MSSIPKTLAGWNGLRCLTVAAAVARGLAVWRLEDRTLMLFPGAWYPYIPDGYEMETIDGRTIRFGRTTDRDTRYGFLAFGICCRRGRYE